MPCSTWTVEMLFFRNPPRRSKRIRMTDLVGEALRVPGVLVDTLAAARASQGAGVVGLLSVALSVEGNDLAAGGGLGRGGDLGSGLDGDGDLDSGLDAA